MVKRTPARKPTKSAKSKSSSQQKADVDPLPAALPPLQSPDAQQRLLDIFSNAFADVLFSDTFHETVQEVKQALFNRDFAAAFGREDYLEAYAARWSPSRALGYATVLLGLREHLDTIFTPYSPESHALSVSLVVEGQVKGEAAAERSRGADDQSAPAPEPTASSEPAVIPKQSLKVLSVGGCAAELVAFASYAHETSSHGALALLDSGPWSSAISRLSTATTSPPTLSKYASATAKAANHALLSPTQFAPKFIQDDILGLGVDALAAMCGPQPLLLTMLFTLNELYTSGGIAKTTQLLKTLGSALAAGSLFLVVDSPGSYSETAVGKEQKRYPMQWLLDHTLLETEAPGYTWEKLESDDSIWFRMPDDLAYPIPLENMRYQLHLYRLVKP